MDRLIEARDARARQDWQACFDALTAAGAQSSDPAVEAERLDLLADAAWWLGRLDDCIDARERAYVLYDELGDDRRAGQCGVWLYEHHCFRASPSIAGGWLRRARRALDANEDCAAMRYRLRGWYCPLVRHGQWVALPMRPQRRQRTMKP